MSDDAGGGGRHETPEFRRVRSGPLPPGDARGARPRARSRTPFALPSAQARRKRVALLLAGTMSVIVLLASGSAWALTGWVSGQLNRDNVFAGLFDGDRPAAGPEGALNFLVIGSDSRGGMEGAEQEELSVGDVEGERSDTMMLVHLNSDRDRITVVGIPRDSWVDVPGHGRNKINAAYAYGGPVLAIRTVESATGVRVDHYVEVDFTGFVDVVEALDGIEVCLPEPIRDEKANLDMAAGTHQVDGVEALAFARTRKSAGGDLDRIDRQQQVMSALLDKALASETLSDPGRFANFLDSALGSITVDDGLDTAAINRLGGQLRSFSLQDVSFTQVPIADMDFRTPSGELAVAWNEEQAGELFGDIAADRPLDGPAGAGGESGEAEDEPVAPGDVTLEVFNGVGTPGLGASVRGDLVGAGFQVPSQAQNWPTRDVAETVVRHAPSQAGAAQAVVDAIPGARAEQDDALGERVQVVIGFNYVSVEAPQSTSPEPSPAGTANGRGGVQTDTAADNVCD
ncbi:LCP family protein required for cell wall assembly [Spinactinospora alkalitolerans]|uniref:LCP family protein required for cell wall assembly n=1 Tax=Spinactinospora alkalitolerans TaxID=687207 RepID=A0A852U282_9ACTN|nr:LCP family protein [Spinactinospora alkalitolerans]NYE49707.1 LCP family protein required for cell wall assembly [Spinactinospora alkalitolerans]